MPIQRSLLLQVTVVVAMTAMSYRIRTLTMLQDGCHVYFDIDNISEHTKTYSTLICQSFPFMQI